MDFYGKTALVTGASRGIGRAIAHALARQGMQRILLVARNAQRLEAVATEVRQLGAEAVVLPVDLSDPIQANVVIARAWQHHGPVHLLVNCAGVAHQVPFLQAKLPQVQSEISTNLIGLYTVTRLVARRMAVRQEGCIVNVSSLMGKVAAPTMATYSATKFAIVGFTQALRSELAPHRVRVVALLPSLTDTDMVKGFEWFRGVQPSTPDQVAAALVRGLNRGQAEILVGWQSHAAIWTQRLAPWLIDPMVQLLAPPKPEPQRRPVRSS
ncbi:SDR family NAD(P)-dependent oxidoreductase [Nodosilinea sp. E11]|uniref:SDR family NAD(P)-dependent oxidoreductase n=1 Tax=Nodosilinea sp. E11 TaxID=3037479 RepID=UPI002934DA8D|nr:SDR family NAD(P)-dependent oxidoreductase [Nodosilinea sp. E11]WOD37443.1 SDR family NAD(P)-dependent oxidoreductase [Nodosilinea sp. E11]